MNRRCFAWVGIWAAAVVVVGVALVPVAGQGRTSGQGQAPAGKSAAPRTPWGDPDIQGVYNYATTVPFERPVADAGKAALTKEEAQKRLQSRIQGQDAAPRAGDPGTYNAFWRDLVDLEAWGLVDDRTSLIIDPADGRLPPFTLEAQQKVDADRASEAVRAKAARARGEAPAESWDDFVLNDRCILWEIAGPPMFPGPYNNNFQLFQGPGYVAIMNEMIHDVRMIPLDAKRSPLVQSVRQWQGDSRGHWEGETLVVETANFNDRTNFRGSSKNMQLTERFTRVNDKTLRYEFTVNDPTVWTKPWTAHLPMTKVDDMIYEYACHEGNVAMTNSLSGSRAKEKADADAAAKSAPR